LAGQGISGLWTLAGRFQRKILHTTHTLPVTIQSTALLRIAVGQPRPDMQLSKFAMSAAASEDNTQP
jgi:hypothetical protein